MLNDLERKLRANRHEKAIKACARVLDGVGVAEPDRRVLGAADADELWRRYLTRLRAGGDVRDRWSSGEIEDVQVRVERLKDAIRGERVVWFALVDGEAVGIEVPADPMVAAALGYLVSPAGDLMLASKDATDGVSIELNHVPTGDEYEIVTWGRFSS